MDELYKDVMQDYRFKGVAVELAERLWNIHLKDYFGGMKAARLGTVHISGYVEKRLGQKAAKGTINRELAPRQRVLHWIRRGPANGCMRSEGQEARRFSLHTAEWRACSIRRGVPQKTARTISGHKTDSAFSRYNIVSDAIADAAKKNEEGAKAVIHS